MFKCAAVTDANIWNDLRAADLLREAFQLPIDFVVPDIILEELLDLDKSKLVSLGLTGGELSSAGVLQVAALRRDRRCKGLSTADLFALVLAKNNGCLLLTGDAELRRVAEEEGISVRGTLWLLDQLVTAQVISPERAAQAIESMIRQGRRLPRAQCAERLQRWRSAEPAESPGVV